MKNSIKALIAASLCLSLTPAFAQMGANPHGGMGMGPAAGLDFTGPLGKLFGGAEAFSAKLQMQLTLPNQAEPLTVPGKIAVDHGKSRFEMNMTEAAGPHMPPGAAEQLKAMGMDQIIMISLPDQKTNYMVYPSLTAYVGMPVRNPELTRPESDFKIEKTELGKETIAGHPCVKNKDVVTDNKGDKHESTVWNATDLKDFPLKIETTENNHTMTLLFTDVTLSAPKASLFSPPSDYKKYDNQMDLMREQMMKRMGGGAGMPQGHP